MKQNFLNVENQSCCNSHQNTEQDGETISKAQGERKDPRTQEAEKRKEVQKQLHKTKKSKAMSPLGPSVLFPGHWAHCTSEGLVFFLCFNWVRDFSMKLFNCLIYNLLPWTIKAFNFRIMAIFEKTILPLYISLKFLLHQCLIFICLAQHCRYDQIITFT